MVARSFDRDPKNTVVLPAGQRAHRDTVRQNEVIKRQFESPCAGVWSLVGNGLSNQTFVKARDGVIAIDTGESIEEMREALRELRAVERAPIAGVIYTHFHYVDGTAAILEDAGATGDGKSGATGDGRSGAKLQIVGHKRIASNRTRASAEIGPAYSRGLVEQFAIALPADGPDGLVNVGLGRFYRNPEHAPFTSGHLPVTQELDDTSGTFTLAGETIEWAHCPSDADDSVNFYFSSRGLCVHNTVWPVLFNVYAIRGEEYRDPRVLLRGFDQVLAWEPEHLVGAHGPAISGKKQIRERVTRSRDAIQFLWDQTVRGINKGWTADEIADRVKLPAACDADYLTSELYGVAEHHVRQIFAGLRGWFDGDETKLFPLAPAERYQKLIDGFGGRNEVRTQAAAALDANDVRWATELAGWLARTPEATGDDRALLARCMRTIGERTPAANIRNWALTRARHLDGSGPMDRYNQHRFSPRLVRHHDNATIINTLRVTLEPSLIEGIDHLVTFVIDGERHSLHVRNGVAVPTQAAGGGAGAAASGAIASSTSEATLTRSILIDVLSGRTTWSECVTSGAIQVLGDTKTLDTVRAAFDVPGLKS
ncbi:MAG: alkyl sulfatase dimerization domain-containing protein [Ilumatobacteraceae bacterium]